MIPPDCDRPLLSCTWVTPVSSRVIVLLGWFVSNASIWAISDRAPSTTPASWAVNYNTQWTDVLDLHKSVDRCICSISIGHKMCKAGQNFISRQSQFHFTCHGLMPQSMIITRSFISFVTTARVKLTVQYMASIKCIQQQLHVFVYLCVSTE